MAASIAIKEPTEMSISPVRSTNINPQATMAVGAQRASISFQFRAVRNPLSIEPTKAVIAMIKMPSPTSRCLSSHWATSLNQVIGRLPLMHQARPAKALLPESPMHTVVRRRYVHRGPPAVDHTATAILASQTKSRESPFPPPHARE